MKVSDIDFSAYEYKRVCILGRTRIHFPTNTEETVQRVYGDCVLTSDPEVKETGWLVLNVEK